MEKLPDPARPPEAPARPRRPRSSVAIGGLCALAVVATLYIGRTFFLPVIVAVFLTLLLDPVVRGLARVRVPRALGAGLVVATLVAILGGALWALGDPAAEWLERAPRSLAQAEVKLRPIKDPVKQVNQATEEVEKLTRVGESGPAPQQVEVKDGDLAETLFGGARRLLAAAAVALMLLYFLLASGDRLLRRFIRVLESPDHRRRAVAITRRIQSDLSTFLATITLINLVLGLAVAAAMWWLGLPNPMLWGAMAAILNYVPYLGALIGIGVVGVVALLTFDTTLAIALPPLVYFGLTAIEGNLLTPLILGRRLILNPVAILLGLIFWGWLWGIAGAVLAVPLLVSLKVVGAHSRRLAPVGALLAA